MKIWIQIRIQSFRIHLNFYNIPVPVTPDPDPNWAILLDPDPNWAKLLDPDPNSMYWDPQLCSKPLIVLIFYSSIPVSEVSPIVSVAGQSAGKFRLSVKMKKTCSSTVSV